MKSLRKILREDFCIVMRMTKAVFWNLSISFRKCVRMCGCFVCSNHMHNNCWFETIKKRLSKWFDANIWKLCVSRRFFPAIKHVKAIEKRICIHPNKIILNSDRLFKCTNFHTFYFDFMVHLIFISFFELIWIFREQWVQTYLLCKCFCFGLKYCSKKGYISAVFI